jgi:hypothetical protein
MLAKEILEGLISEKNIKVNIDTDLIFFYAIQVCPRESFL